MMRTITSLDHPTVKHLVKIRVNRDYRYEHRTVVIPGIKASTELMRDNQVVRLVVIDETFVPGDAKADEILVVSEAVMKKISGLVNPEEMLIEIKMPPSESLEYKDSLVVLDGISDPGNMGTLIRTALALGWEGVYITENSCDPFNDKALRAAKGATFRVPIGMGSWTYLKELIANGNFKAFAADLEGKSPSEVNFKGSRVALVLGNEANGLSPEAKAICEKVTIPMSGKMESLNVSVAGGILMYFLLKAKLP